MEQCRPFFSRRGNLRTIFKGRYGCGPGTGPPLGHSPDGIRSGIFTDAIVEVPLGLSKDSPSETLCSLLLGAPKGAEEVDVISTVLIPPWCFRDTLALGAQVDGLGHGCSTCIM